ncbi:MAG: hypothetical protein DMG20_14430, partial [Acidobacteria bacterium]
PVTTASQQQSKTSAGVAALPQADGVYYRQSAAKWIQLTQARVADSKIRGMETYLQTDGLTGLNMNFVYPGAHAAIQIEVIPAATANMLGRQHLDAGCRSPDCLEIRCC